MTLNWMHVVGIAVALYVIIRLAVQHGTAEQEQDETPQ